MRNERKRKKKGNIKSVMREDDAEEDDAEEDDAELQDDDTDIEEDCNDNGGAANEDGVVEGEGYEWIPGVAKDHRIAHMLADEFCRGCDREIEPDDSAAARVIECNMCPFVSPSLVFLGGPHRPPRWFQPDEPPEHTQCTPQTSCVRMFQ